MNKQYTVMNKPKKKNKTKKTIPFTLASKRLKYLGINFTKEVQTVCSEKYKVLKEIKDYLNKSKDILWVGRQYC